MADTLLIRADAGLKMGTGHVMRCLALAQGWQNEGGEALFAMVRPLPALESRLKSEGMKVAYLPDILPGSQEDAQETALLGRQNDTYWIVIDGYHFGANYQKYLKDAGYYLLSFDGYGHAEHYFSDLIINQNIYADAAMYKSKESYTKLLLGASFILLRREFWPWRDWQREIPQNAQKILVTLGGSDPDNITLKALKALLQMKNETFQIVAIVGGGNPYYSELKTIIEMDVKPIHLEQDVANMPKRMAWADLAISAAGGTCWELAFMGVPSLLLVLAENQEKVAYYLHEKNAAICLGSGKRVTESTITSHASSLMHNPSMRRNLSSESASFVDGLGVKRVVSLLKKG